MLLSAVLVYFIYSGIHERVVIAGDSAPETSPRVKLQPSSKLETRVNEGAAAGAAIDIGLSRPTAEATPTRATSPRKALRVSSRVMRTSLPCGFAVQGLRV